MKLTSVPTTRSNDGLSVKAGTLADRLMHEIAAPAKDVMAVQGALLERALAYAAEVEERLKTQEERLLYLEGLTLTDELTNLLNRRGFMLQMQRVLAAARRYGETGVVIYCDLDHFKAVNDSLGHACGDEVLRSVSRVLAAAVRSIDVAGRLGGDEFALCLVQTTLKDGLKRAAGLQWLLDHTQLDWHGAAITLRATLGIEPYSPNDAVNELIARADMAMYYNKRRKYANATPLAAE